MKTKDLIFILPFEEDVRQQLAQEFDTLDAERKYEIVELLWDAYDALYGEMLEKNSEEALQNIMDGTEEVGDDFYARMREKTAKDMQEQNVSTHDETKLAAARKAMELIMKEIHAAKKN